MCSQEPLINSKSRNQAIYTLLSLFICLVRLLYITSFFLLHFTYMFLPIFLQPFSFGSFTHLLLQLLVFAFIHFQTTMKAKNITIYNKQDQLGSFFYIFITLELYIVFELKYLHGMRVFPSLFQEHCAPAAKLASIAG